MKEIIAISAAMIALAVGGEVRADSPEVTEAKVQMIQYELHIDRESAEALAGVQADLRVTVNPRLMQRGTQMILAILSTATPTLGEGAYMVGWTVSAEGTCYTEHVTRQRKRVGAGLPVEAAGFAMDSCIWRRTGRHGLPGEY